MVVFEDRLEPGEQPPPNWELVLWDDAILERFERWSLSFWRLAFGPLYDRARILEILDDFYVDYGVHAHIAYETLGDYDILLRLWLPREYTAAEIGNEIRSRLANEGLMDLKYIVGSTTHHSRNALVDQNRDAQPGEPTKVSVSNDEIAAVNAYNRAQVAGKPSSRPDVVDYLIDQGVLAPVPLGTRGIRLLITFDLMPRQTSSETRDRIGATISRIVQDKEERWRAELADLPEHDRLMAGSPDTSMMTGIGSLSEFLVLARAPRGYFHPFVQELTTALRSSEFLQLGKIRPYTFVLADRMFVEATEERPAVVSDTTIDVDSTESETLEFKATFSVSLDRLLRGDARIERNLGPEEAVVKTACGFLNTTSGGRIVIGVLEVGRAVTKSKSADEAERYLSQLGKKFGYDLAIAQQRLTERKPLRNAVIGTDLEFGENPAFADSGAAFRDQDEYLRAIQEKLDTAIAPGPAPWIKVGATEFDGKNLVVIDVRPADTWCYARRSGESAHTRFFVREGASTREYSGPLADVYKRSVDR